MIVSVCARLVEQTSVNLTKVFLRHDVGKAVINRDTTSNDRNFANFFADFSSMISERRENLDFS